MDFMLSEINQTEKKILHDLTYTWNVKNKNKLIGTNRWFPETREIVYQSFKLSVIK